MKLIELAPLYRRSAALLGERIALLREVLAREGLGEMEKLRLRGRIDALAAMRREVQETARRLERYYLPGGRR